MSQKIVRFHLPSLFRGSLKSRVVYLCKKASLQFFIREGFPKNRKVSTRLHDIVLQETNSCEKLN